MSSVFTKSAAVVGLVFGLALSAAPAFAAMTAPSTSSASKCELNGEPISCDELAQKAKGFLGYGIAAFVVIGLFILWATIFWIMMLVHVASHEVPNKAVWIILMIFTGLLGSLAYYFAVKRSFVATPTVAQPPVAPLPPSAPMAS